MQSQIIIKINQVIDHIESTLSEEQSLKKLAQIANMSKFHFHRTFKLVTQESPNEYLNRKRIEKIASLLLFKPDESISNLSFKYGFQNLSSFSRSFKKYYGFSASELKQKTKRQLSIKTSNNSKIGQTLISSNEYLCSIEKTKDWMDEKAEITTQYIPEIKLAYVRHWGNPYTIHEAFDKLLAWCQNVHYDSKGKDYFTLFHDNPNLTIEYKIQQSACIEIRKQTNLSSTISTLSIPAQKYVIGKFQLSDHEFEMAWDSMIVWINEKNISTTDGHIFERFLNNSLFDDSSMYQVEIGIPIK